MYIRELSLKEFENFTKNNDYNTYHQTLNYAIFKASNDYEYEIIGYVDDNNEIHAAALILVKLLDGYLYGYMPQGPIIDFSNEQFYGGKLRIMNKETNLKDVLELITVKDATVDLDMTKNLAETEELVKRLQELIAEDDEKKPKTPLSIGIISPFRGQVEQIKKAIKLLVAFLFLVSN